MPAPDDATLFAEQLQQAQHAQPVLAGLSGAQRDRGILALADAVGTAIDEILEANTLDLEAGREMAVPELVLSWLKLTPERLEAVVALCHHLARLPDPLQHWGTNAMPLADGTGRSYQQAVPLGTIAFVCEAFTDLSAIAAAMSLKTANSILLRGGSETSHTNAVFSRLCKRALSAAELPPAAIAYVTDERSTVLQELISSKPDIALVLVHGRSGLLQQATQGANVPVWPLSMGNACLYWAPSGDVERVLSFANDSHEREPDAVNAIEKILVHPSVSPTNLSRAFTTLQEAGFVLRGDPALVDQYPDWLQPATPKDWSCPSFERTLAFRVAESPDAALAWMQEHTGSHAVAIVSQSYVESQQFAAASRATLTYINCSPRFRRHPPHSDRIYLGVAPQIGPIDCNRLTRPCQILEGS